MDMTRMTKYLAETIEDPIAQAGVFCLSPTPALKENLIKMAETNPVAAAVLAGQAVDSKSKLDYAQKLIVLSPDNALGYLLAADADFAAGRTEEAKAMLDNAHKAPSLETFLGELAGSQDAAWKAEGRDALDRSLLSNADPWRKKIFNTVGYLALRDLPEDETELATRASESLAFISQLKNQTKGTVPLSADRQLLSLESTVLQSIPGDFNYGNGMTISQYSDALGKRQQELERTNDEVRDVLGRSSLNITEEYYKRAKEQGELEAAAWLVGRNVGGIRSGP